MNRDRGKKGTRDEDRRYTQNILHVFSSIWDRWFCPTEVRHQNHKYIVANTNNKSVPFKNNNDLYFIIQTIQANAVVIDKKATIRFR